MSPLFSQHQLTGAHMLNYWSVEVKQVACAGSLSHNKRGRAQTQTEVKPAVVKTVQDCRQGSSK